ncbi:MAG: hypothetical protein RL681_313 [Candidatus Parcubacteria bacterium]|jgi:hypothetical protein
MSERNCEHFKGGLPKDPSTGELLPLSPTEIANFRCPCEKGVEHPDPEKRVPGYPFQPHAV